MVYKSVDDTACASFCLHFTLEYLNMLKQMQGCKPTMEASDRRRSWGNQHRTAALRTGYRTHVVVLLDQKLHKNEPGLNFWMKRWHGGCSLCNLRLRGGS